MEMKSWFIVFSLTLIPCWAATVTLFAVATTSYLPVSQTYSPIGTGSNGETTYFNEIVASVYYQAVPTTLVGAGGSSTITGRTTVTTFTSDPITIRATLVADASHLSYHKEPDPTGTRIGDVNGNNLACDFDGKGGGSCVDEVWVRGQSTFTTTYTGTAVPYYTLVAPESETSSTINTSTTGGSQGGTPNTAAATGSCIGVIGWCLTVLAVQLGLLYVWS